MSIQAKEGITRLSYGIPFEQQTDLQNGHTAEAQSSNGATKYDTVAQPYKNCKCLKSQVN